MLGGKRKTTSTFDPARVGNLAILSLGNTKLTCSSGNSGSLLTNGPKSSGKWYAEFVINTLGGTFSQVGIMLSSYTTELNSGNSFGLTANGWGYAFQTGAGSGGKSHLNSPTSYGGPWISGDIIGVALDIDNLALYFSKNGVWQQVGGITGDPTSGAAKTGAAFSITSGSYFIGADVWVGGGTTVNQIPSYSIPIGYSLA